MPPASPRCRERFKELVDAAAGGELSDYTLRRIGSELEGIHPAPCSRPEKLSYNPDWPCPELLDGSSPKP